jgi:hypothetical protein
MPGLAASATIFEKNFVAGGYFEMHLFGNSLKRIFG